MASSIRLAVIGGDGIGPEVTAEALKVLRAAAPEVSFDTTDYDLGARRYHRTGETLPDTVLEEIRAHDAILLGAIGDPSVPSGVLERGLLLRLRFELDHYVNLRPVRLLPGVASPLTAGRPETIDMVVVREGTEGPYTGAGGVMRKGTPQEIATQESLNTAFGVERVARYAFAVATARPRKKLTLVHKTNVLTYAGDLWQRNVEALAKEFPEVSVDYQHVDAASMFFVTQPQRFDVIVTDNLFGDILTDLGAAIAGRHRPGGQREHQPRAHRAVDVRAGARVRARHRRAVQGRPDRRDLVGGAAAVAPRLRRARPPAWSRPSPTTWWSARASGRRGLPWRSARTSPREYLDDGPERAGYRARRAFLALPAAINT